MTIDEILEQLSNNPEGSFPHAAVEQQEAITPHLLANLQKLVGLGEDIDDDFNDGLTLFAIFLLAQFREARAYPLIIHLLTCGEDSAEFYFGDAITGGMPRILASICHGDIAPLKALVENVLWTIGSKHLPLTGTRNRHTSMADFFRFPQTPHIHWLGSGEPVATSCYQPAKSISYCWQS